MKILYFGVDPEQIQGYGKVARYTLPIIAKEHKVAVYTFSLVNHSSYFDSKIKEFNWNGIKIIPAQSSSISENLAYLKEIYKREKADLLLPYFDQWIVPPFSCKYIPWAVIDQEPLSERNYLNLEKAVHVAVMSKFAKELLDRYNIDSTVIPHGVDPCYFKKRDKSKARKKIFGSHLNENDFLIGAVSANFGQRKNLPELLRAFSILLRSYPNIHLHIHCQPASRDGFNLTQLAYDVLKIPQHKFTYPTKINWTENEMAELYTSFDILVNVSNGEAFGIPILESLSTGTPVIATNYSSMPELLDNGRIGTVNNLKLNGSFEIAERGILVNPRMLQFTRATNSQYALVYGADLARAIEWMIYNNKEISEMGRKGKEFAKKLTWDEIGNKWLNLINSKGGS